MAEHLPDNLPAAKNRDIKKREKMYAEMCPALRGKVDYVIKWSQDDARYNLLNRHDLGNEIKDVYDEKVKDNKNKVYGARAFEKIALFSGEDSGMLRTAVRLSQTWTKKQLQDITEMVMMDKITPVSYSHIRWLLTVDTPQGRQEALNKTIENCWTSTELARYIQELYSRPASNAGRGPAIPKTLDGLITQQRQYAEDFETRYSKVWSDQRYSLATQVQNLSPEQVTEELAKKVGDLAAHQRMLAQKADEMAKQTELQHRRLMDQLKKPLPLAKGKAKATAEPDEEDEDDTPRPKKRDKVLVGSRALTVKPLGFDDDDDDED